jgi:hypothetical protein
VYATSEQSNPRETILPGILRAVTAGASPALRLMKRKKDVVLANHIFFIS